MTKRRTTRQNNKRWDDSSETKEKHIKPKHHAHRVETQLLNPVKPMNKKQGLYIDLINDMDIIVATGFAGTSKTYIPTAIACDMMRLGRLNKIIFSRPAVSNSKSLGFFSGDLIEKAKNWLTPVLSVCNERMGRASVEIAIGNGDIEFQPLETIKGLSVNDAWLIVDEAEDLNVDEIKKVVTRMGKNSKLILAGDITQAELGEKNGLKWFVDFVKRHNLSDSVGCIDFNDANDIVRSDVVKKIIVAIERDKRKEGR